MAGEPPNLPPDLRQALQGYQIAIAGAGESASAVYQLSDKAGAPDLFLKYGRAENAEEILAEAARLRWMRTLLPVPEIANFTFHGDEAWLLTQALEGQSASQLLEGDGDTDATVDALAHFLRMIHAIPTHLCPFDSSYPFRLAQARRNIDAGHVDIDDFDDVRQGWSAEQVWDALQSHLPLDAGTVVTHGDFSLDNIFLNNGAVVGCLDVGEAGLADPYQDIAIMWNCLGDFGTKRQNRFLRAYGVRELDRSKLDFHLLLDELF